MQRLSTYVLSHLYHRYLVSMSVQGISNFTSKLFLQKDDQHTKFWPGLGESESVYANVLTVYAIGEILGSLIAGLMTDKLPYILSLLWTSMLYSVGGVIYSLAANGSMVIAARFLHGLGNGIGNVIIHTYIGGMGTRMDELRRKKDKSPLKPRIYIAFSFLLNGGSLFGLG